MFYHMIGRYYIRMGEYDKGMVYIEKLKMLNSEKFKLYLQTVSAKASADPNFTYRRSNIREWRNVN